MKSSKHLKKICTAVAVSVLASAFAVSSAACSHKHAFSEDWTSDETYHWHKATCAHTDEISDKAEHVYGTDDVCDVCSYDRSSGKVTPPPEDPTNPDPTNPTDPTAQKFTISFESNGGSAVVDQTVTKGGKLQRPAAPEKANYMFAGWYTNAACTAEYDFDKTVASGFTLYAKWVELNSAIKSYKGYNESLAVEWSGDATSSTVKYKEKTASEWKTLDAPLVRSIGNGIARADVLGLAEGDYNVKIEGSSTIELPAPITVTAHDRSGYAHFNRKTGEAAYEGIGAYKDDGTLKDNALVIYVTDANKDEVMANVDAKYKFNIPTYFSNKWNGKQADGIGWWLNNAQYSKAEKNSSGVAIENKSSNTYDPNGTKLAFAKVVADNIPICIRFIGTVTTPEGCTEYDSLNEGGTPGDNGHMARMKDLKNVTVEGVGEDATLDGWGIHFMVGDSSNGKGSSFETRNLTFVNYPEDALGMEGASADNKWTSAPVSRCWVHNNTFLPGYANPTAASDKSEGDGSCDFKRGEYFTLSYNYFTDCHKTNLIGASTKNWQYNITFHHNWWNNAQSRVPLMRNANIHFYNNYISAEDNGGNDYVHALEGTSYMLSEGNYYFNCKQVTREEVGIGKSWQNTFYGCFGANQFIKAETREQSVSNSCKYYDNTSLENFDTNPSQFYYDTANKKSDCLLDDSVSARLKVMEYAGVNNWSANNPKKQGTNVSTTFKANINQKTPASAVPVPDDGTLNIAIPTSKNDATVNGVMFHNLTGASSGTVKGKGQIITFTLATEAEITLSASASDNDYAAELVSANGAVYAGKVNGTVKVTLPAGTYFISSGSGTLNGSNAKEVTISALSFSSTAGSAQAKIDNLNAAIDAIPDTVTVESESLINAAKVALAALNADQLADYQQNNAARYEKLNNAITALDNAKVANVVSLINAIGTVNDNSYPAIKAARDAYTALTDELKAQVTNLSTLTAAEESWANRAVTAINSQITALDDVTSWTKANGKDAITAKKAEYETVKSAYEALSSTDGVVGYDKVTNGLTKLNALLAEIAQDEVAAANLADFLAKLNEVTIETVNTTNFKPVLAAYEKLTEAQQQALEEAVKTKYNQLNDKYTELAEEEAKLSQYCSFDSSGNPTNSFFTLSAGTKRSDTVTVDGTEYSVCVKNPSISFTTSATMQLTLYFSSRSAGKTIIIDGTSYTIDNSTRTVTVTLQNGDHTITSESSDRDLGYIKLTPVASTSTASYALEEIDLEEAKSLNA